MKKEHENISVLNGIIKIIRTLNIPFRVTEKTFFKNATSIYNENFVYIDHEKVQNFFIEKSKLFRRTEILNIRNNEYYFEYVNQDDNYAITQIFLDLFNIPEYYFVSEFDSELIKYNQK